MSTEEDRQAAERFVRDCWRKMPLRVRILGRPWHKRIIRQEAAKFPVVLVFHAGEEDPDE